MPAERRRAFLAPLGEVHVDGVRLDVEANDVDAYRHGAMSPAPMALASVATV
jgi:hypothetical protein